MTFWSLPKQVALINVYIMFCRIAAMDVRYVLQQWYTTLKCNAGQPNPIEPRLPNFPNTVYQMMGLVLGNACTLFGIWLFENYVYYWNSRKAFWVTTVFTMVAALFDLSMLTRFNQTMWAWFPAMSNRISFLCGEDAKGQPTCSDDGYRLDDLFGFLIGMQALKPIATTLDDMPATILLSKLCPAGVETTVFAMLAAIQNLGLTHSGLSASIFFDAFGVDMSGTKCQEGHSKILGFDLGVNGIQLALIFGGILLPATTIPATFCLIPDKPLNGKFVDDVPPAEVELANNPVHDDGHPAASFGRQSPSYVGLGDAGIAPQDELEKASSLLFKRGGTGMGSRVL